MTAFMQVHLCEANEPSLEGYPVTGSSFFGGRKAVVVKSLWKGATASKRYGLSIEAACSGSL